MAEKSNKNLSGLEKAASGIQGLDEITRGGLPRNRTILVSGGPGCGKTLLGLEFLYRGAAEMDEPGVFVSFEENADELVMNTASLGWDIEGLVKQNKLFMEYVQVERDEILETGSFDLEALFIRLKNAVDTVGAKRIVLDTVESLFSSLPNEALLRSELRRLFRWLKDQGLTAIITGEKGESTLTRHGLEEYVSDCVISLSHRTVDEVSTRRMRIVKYRGSNHGTNQYPFLINDRGFSILPITSIGLDHPASEEKISTGLPKLDKILMGGGFYKGSSVLVSGTAGTGKSSLAAAFATVTCDRGERCLYIAYEESTGQIIRNMRSIGIDLSRHVESGLLEIERGGLGSSDH